MSRTAGWAIAAALAVGAGWLWQQGQAPDRPPAAVSGIAHQADATLAVPAADAALLPTPPRAGAGAFSVGTAADDATPPGLTDAQWAAVLARLAGQPDAAAERQRLAAYFGWAHAVQRWRATPGDTALARQVDTGLPERLAQREVSAAEARQLKLALLQTLSPDDATRAAALQAFDEALPAPATPDPRQQAFAQAQSAVVAAWQAQPTDQRDPQALARDLAALRQSHYSDAPQPQEPR